MRSCLVRSIVFGRSLRWKLQFGSAEATIAAIAQNFAGSARPHSASHTTQSRQVRARGAPARSTCTCGGALQGRKAIAGASPRTVHTLRPASVWHQCWDHRQQHQQPRAPLTILTIVKHHHPSHCAPAFPPHPFPRARRTARLRARSAQLRRPAVPPHRRRAAAPRPPRSVHTLDAALIHHHPIPLPQSPPLSFSSAPSFRVATFRRPPLLPSPRLQGPLARRLPPFAFRLPCWFS